MKIQRLHLGLLVLGFLLVGCASLTAHSPENSPQEILAKIGNHIITLSEFEERINALPSHRRQRLLNNKKQKIKFLKRVVEIYVCSLEARKKGLDRDKLIQFRIQDAVDTILAREYIKREVFDNITISDKEVEEYYKTHLQEFTRPEQVRARHILVKVNPKGKPEEWEKALIRVQELKRELDKGADFATLAKKNSDDSRTKTRGGYLGYITKGKFAPEFSEAAFSLKVGEISEPVKTSQGYHLIKVEDKRPEKIRPLNEVKEYIKSKLREKKERAEVKKTIESLKKEYKVILNTDLLSSENTAVEKAGE